MKKLLMKKPELSVVIPSHNTKDLLRDCLESIFRLTDTAPLEVVVVDNASSDGSREMVSKDFPLAGLIINGSNLGFAKAANQGWKASRGSLVLFLNSDTKVKGYDTFQKVIEYCKENGSTGALSGKLVLRSGRLDPDAHRGFPTPWSSLSFFSGLEKLFPRSKLFGQYHQGWKDLDTIHEIDAGCGAFLVVRRTVLEAVNGWDESYFFYGEDIDLCFRIKEAGWEVVYYPFIDVLHYKGASSGLRKETKDIVTTKKDTLLKVAGASVKAWERFYKKFYQGKYPFYITRLVLTGIRLKGFLRIAKFKIFGS